MIATWKQHEGQAVDGIALLRLLGGGESSAVYLAERAGERCAVKFVPAEEVVAQLPLTRWEQASKLSHPHLSRVFQWGRGLLDGVPLVYVAMEFAEEDLSGVDRPLTPKEAREMLTPAAKALAYLHGKGFAHGRIKPSNILSVQEELKISGDSPLRKGERHASSSTPSPYDPPELAASGVTPSGDVWSLGVSLVEAMTKELPRFEGNFLRLPDSLRPDSFRDVAAGCLERDPARRWTIADITQWLDRGTVPAPKRVRPRYLLPAAAAVAVVALGAAVWEYGGPFFTSSPSSDPPATTAPAQPPVQSTTPQEPVTPPPVVAAQPAKPTREPKPSAKEPDPAPAAKPDTPPANAPAPPSNSAFLPAQGVTAADVVQSMVPDVPAKSRTTVHGKVPIVVRVQADAAGAVTSAKIESGGSSKYFGDLSLKAARQWKFAPGADGREWLLRFEYTKDAQHPVTAQVILGP
ncbi:MAG TPA: protein kinase [Bryobacteraceae bacterium]|jgi:serine/threonine-protein kinase